METVLIIPNHESYWVGEWCRKEMLSFTPEYDFSVYTTAEFMQLIIDRFGNTGNRQFQLSQRIMKYYFDKDKPHLLDMGETETGDPYSSVFIHCYTDKRTNNTWKYEVSHGSGLHGFTGSFYYYQIQGYSFRSNDQLDRM